MIEEQAIVVGVEGDVANVEIERRKPCGLCGSSGSGCGMTLWGRLFSGHRRAISLQNTLGVSQGERVVVAMDDGVLLQAALMAFLLPCLFLFVGAWTGAHWVNPGPFSDGAAVLGALAGLGLAVPFVRRRARQLRPASMVRRAGEDFVRQCSRVIS